jgi:recombination protein RecA
VHSWATDEKITKNQCEKTEFRLSNQILNKLLGRVPRSDALARVGLFAPVLLGCTRSTSAAIPHANALPNPKSCPNRNAYATQNTENKQIKKINIHIKWVTFSKKRHLFRESKPNLKKYVGKTTFALAYLKNNLFLCGVIPPIHNQQQLMSSERDQKLKSLQATLDRIEKTYGKGSIMKLGDAQTVETEVISSGSIGLDLALGCGGFPKGRIVEIYGPESSGKTTLAIHAIAECQKAGGVAAIIDAEHAFDRFYAEALGVDVDNLLIAQPDFGEQALEIADSLIRSGAIDIIVIDSVAALVPRAEIEGEMGDSKMGLQARLMSQALRKLTATIGRTNCCVIFINQLREKIGVMFGNPETTTGGNALKFYASIRLDIRKSGTALKDKEGTMTGNHVKVKVVKNKMAPPFRIAEFDIIFGEGISKAGEIVDMGVDLELIDKSGAWYAYKGAKIAQGREAARQFLLDNPEASNEIEAEIRERYSKAPMGAPKTSNTTDDEE